MRNTVGMQPRIRSRQTTQLLAHNDLHVCCKVQAGGPQLKELKSIRQTKNETSSSVYVYQNHRTHVPHRIDKPE